MNFKTTQLTAQQITDYYEKAQEILLQWGRVKTASVPAEMETYQDDIAMALHGVETIEDFIENQIGEWKKRQGSVELLKKDLKNHAEMAKRKFWALRNEQPKNG